MLVDLPAVPEQQAFEPIMQRDGRQGDRRLETGLLDCMVQQMFPGGVGVDVRTAGEEAHPGNCERIWRAGERGLGQSVAFQHPELRLSQPFQR